MRYGYTNNGSNSCCYNTTFNWGNSFAINYGNVTYDSSANTYTVTANEGYGYYNLYVNSGTFTIYTDPYVVSGQSASVIMTAFPFVYDYLLDKVKKSEITSFSLYGGNGWLNFSWTKNNSTSTSSFQLADNTSILMDNNGKMYLPTISSTTATEFEVMTSTSCYRYFNSKHDGTTNNYDDNWNQGTNNYTFHVNSAFTTTNNQYIQVAYGYGNSKDVYNGGSNLNIYYRYSGSSIVYSLGNSYNYSNDYSGMTQTIKTNYNLNIELSATSVKYTKEDQAYSGYYYWVRQFYFNNCQYIPSYSTSFISGATYSSNDVQQKDALQTVYTAYETGGTSITSGEVQTMIDESISGKVDTTTFTNILNAYDNALYAISSGVTNLQNTKQDILSAGTGIQISGNVISATGGGGGTYSAGTNISIDSNNVISMTVPISGGSGNSSIKEGGGTTASGAFSHAEGIDTVASGTGAHSEGVETTANGDYSHTEGLGTVTNNMVEHAEGWYNVSNTGNSTSAQTLFSVGNGTANNERHNALEIRKNGDIYFNDGTNDVKLQDKFTTIETTIGNINTILESI